ncbi:hypothetical protein B0H17DRAFT_1220697 [Mycena rosella]|uniref:Uncharacterized protein n=1 Tax=Mycena rosella TaxID=1033263 RepID=A0AAD7FDG1_MYCRO|nr:hypothetical protein B0H17DRAFT_1220697 [Mycena rosella]
MDGFCHFTVDIVYRAITRKPASFFHHAVRNLFLEDPRGTRPADYIAKMHSILAVCTGISDLFADSSLAAPMLTDTLGVVPLDHLTVDVGSLFDGRMMDFSHPIFRQITHLEVLDRSTREASEWEGLASLPHLTHFAFSSPNLYTALIPALLTCPLLECCVLIVPLGLSGSSLVADDIRFVRLSRPDVHADWQRGAHTGENYWTQADALIVATRAGERTAPSAFDWGPKIGDSRG